MGDINFNGRSLSSLGFVVEHVPGYSYPGRDFTFTHIKGRNGDLITDLDEFKNVERSYDIAFVNENAGSSERTGEGQLKFGQSSVIDEAIEKNISTQLLLRNIDISIPFVKYSLDRKQLSSAYLDLASILGNGIEYSCSCSYGNNSGVAIRSYYSSGYPTAIQMKTIGTGRWIDVLNLRTGWAPVLPAGSRFSINYCYVNTDEVDPDLVGDTIYTFLMTVLNNSASYGITLIADVNETFSDFMVNTSSMYAGIIYSSDTTAHSSIKLYDRYAGRLLFDTSREFEFSNLKENVYISYRKIAKADSFFRDASLDNDGNPTYEYVGEAVDASDEERFYKAINKLNSFLHSSNGYAVLEDTYDPKHYRLASFSSEGEIESIYNQGGRGTITFNCKPQRYLKGDHMVSYTDNLNEIHITNPSTTFSSLPIIKLIGSGSCTITVNDISVNITSVDQDLFNINNIIIDSELMDAYSIDSSGNAINRNNNIFLVNDSFPVLKPGENVIYLETTDQSFGVVQVDIDPKWWVI